jgi:hypothetical protein
MSKTPKVDDAIVLITLLYLISIFLKNIKAHKPTAKARMVFESVTKKYVKFLLIFTTSQVPTTTLIAETKTEKNVSQPHNLVFEKDFLG